MQSSGIWVFVIMALVIIVAFLLMRMLKARDGQALSDGDDGIARKYGLPITPRDLRIPPVKAEHDAEQDALSSMAAGVAAAPALKPVASDEALKPTTQTAFTRPQTTAEPVTAAAPSQAVPSQAPSQAAPVEQMADADELSAETFNERPEGQAQVAQDDFEFNKQSPVLDQHLNEQQQFEQNNDPLLNATSTVSVMIMPRNSFAGLPGKTVLSLARQYGLKYGVMNLFHRYENEDGTGDLWFSVLGVGHEGVKAFDLNTLPEDHFLGLTLFLPLPHRHALRGYDSMVSVANAIAKDLDAELLDEEGYQLDEAYFEGMREVVANHPPA